MIKLPKDLEIKLKKKYPTVTNLEEIVNSVFQSIFEKAVEDGNCTILRFGSFFCYKTFSGRKGRDIIRFKFSISRKLDESIKTDDFLIKKVENFVKHDINLDRISDEKKQKIRNENQESKITIFNSKNTTKKKTHDTLVLEEVLSIIHETNDKKDETTEKENECLNL